MSSRYLIVAYDIEDNPTRTKIAEILQYNGLTRIQYSVFAGPVSDKEHLCRILFDIPVAESDNITVFQLCENCLNKVQTIRPLPKKITNLCI